MVVYFHHPHFDDQALFEGDEARGLRELGGIAASDFTACFQKADIEALFLQPLRTVRSMPRVIYLTVDPNGGGMSKMGVVSGFFDGNDIVVSTSSLFVFYCVCACVSLGTPMRMPSGNWPPAYQCCTPRAEAH